MRKDQYEVLGVSRDANHDEIKKAYRKLALQFHPDRCPGDKDAEVKFREIQAAHDSLTGKSVETNHNHFGDSFDIFADLFGGGRRHTPDIPTNTYVEFWESVSGCKKDVTVKKQKECGSCHGTGAEGSRVKACDLCNGHGVLTQYNGAFTISTTCPKCMGRKTFPEKECNDCHGSGKEVEEVVFQIDVPAGIKSGDSLRVPGQGNEINGMKGDAVVRVGVGQHPYFERHGDNLVYQLPIFYWQAVLGDKVNVPTLYEDVKLEIPAETKSGSFLRIPGMGFINPSTKRKGDCIVQIAIETVKCKDASHKKLLEKLKELEEETVKMQVFRKNSTR